MNGLFDHTKWPWTKTSKSFPDKYKGEKAWPKVSVIIPSYNQGNFIEETILSVLNQNYPNLELLIIDGGSTDQTIEIIKKYEGKIDYWISEKDNGQSHAINKGLKKATGDWVAFLNSDDCYLQKAFCHLFMESDIEQYEFIYGDYLMGNSLADCIKIRSIKSHKLTLSNVIRFFYGIDYIIPSQSVFVRKDLIQKVGLLNEKLHYCMDVDWYARILKQKPSIYKYKKTICFFRRNENTKTGSFRFSEENRMGIEAEEIALNYYRDLNFLEKLKFRSLFDFYLMYSKEPWKYDNCTLSYLIKLLIFHPIRSLSDRRILGLLKRRLLFSIL